MKVFLDSSAWPAAAGAQLFITGDQRVLGWHPQGPMGIVSPRQAWQEVVLPEPPD
jgi:hypothetical protein